MRRSCWWVRGFSRGRWVGQRNGMHVGVPLQWGLWGFGKTFWRVPKWLCWGLAGEFGRKKRECPRETRGHLDSSIKCPMSVTSVSWIASIFAPFLLNAPARIEAIISNCLTLVVLSLVSFSHLPHDQLWDLSFYSAVGFGDPWTPFLKLTADKDSDRILALLAKKGVAAAIKVLRIPGEF